MAETQTPPAVGTFCWNELMTTDVEKAKTFYTKLFGWTTREMDMGPSGKYTIFINQGKDIGGCMKNPPEAGGVPPHWLSYVAVSDVDASAGEVVALGGTLIVPPTDIPHVGRFAIINDPTGAAIAVITFSA
jgi:predicted enzyme related to lactoylglutathione lyase